MTLHLVFLAHIRLNPALVTILYIVTKPKILFSYLLNEHCCLPFLYYKKPKVFLLKLMGTCRVRVHHIALQELTLKMICNISTLECAETPLEAEVW